MQIDSLRLSRRELMALTPTLCLGTGSAWAAAVESIALERFGDPANDFGRALEAAVQQAARTGAVVEAQPGRTYVVRSGARLIDIDVRLRMNGARIVRASDAANEPVLTVAHRLSTARPIVAIEQQSIGSVIRLTSTIGWRVGDVGRIVSDDRLPWSDANQRCAESFVVVAVAEGNITTKQPLRLLYSNNVRVAKHQKHQCLISDLRVEDDPHAPAARNAPAVLLKGVVGATVERPVLRRLMGEGLRIECAYAPRTMDGVFANLRTSAADGAFGYGIREVGVTDGLHVGHAARSVRHLYTSWATTSVADNDPQITKYGGVVGSAVRFCRVEEPDDDGISTHPDAFGVSVSEIDVIGARRGAITLRGRSCRVEGCRTSGVGGLTIVGNAHSGAHKVLNYTHQSVAGGNAASAVTVIGAPGYRDRNVVAVRLTGAIGSAPLIVMRQSAMTADIDVEIPALATEGVTLAQISDADLEVQRLLFRKSVAREIFPVGRHGVAHIRSDTRSRVKLENLELSEGSNNRRAQFSSHLTGTSNKIFEIF